MQPAVSLSAPPEPVLVQVDKHAKWSRQVEAEVERITLESGVLSIRVDHALSPRRLLVLLPDGELEDIGTTFSVSAEAGRTTRVAVQEGRVVLRLRGHAALVLAAGESWSPAPALVASSPASHAAPPVEPRAAKTVALLSAAPSLPPVPSTPERAPDSASTDFRAAMAALNGGDSARAASLFASFVAAHPRDPRTEDAAYLRVLALQRSGSAGALQQAARDYLARYPRGFRRSEVEALAR